MEAQFKALARALRGRGAGSADGRHHPVHQGRPVSAEDDGRAGRAEHRRAGLQRETCARRSTHWRPRRRARLSARTRRTWMHGLAAPGVGGVRAATEGSAVGGRPRPHRLARERRLARAGLRGPAGDVRPRRGARSRDRGPRAVARYRSGRPRCCTWAGTRCPPEDSVLFRVSRTSASTSRTPTGAGWAFDQSIEVMAPPP
ncbi:hypothetical protein QJS66_06420 [Kocuria rhizophila]|nr:hypothetical protein QJS66_06420 [Kocuria rhizophila]